MLNKGWENAALERHEFCRRTDSLFRKTEDGRQWGTPQQEYGIGLRSSKLSSNLGVSRSAESVPVAIA